MKNPLRYFIAATILFSLVGCNSNAVQGSNTSITAPSTSALPSTLDQQTEISTPVSSLTPTLPPTATPTLRPPTVTPTATWIFQPAGEVTCPILLYHQIEDINPPSQYYMPPNDFKAQMEALHDWGYTPIPISLLAEAITTGAELPPRPIVITFDDGDENVYTNAFPVMRDLGFPGVLYIISSALGSRSHLTSTEVLEMVVAGWEVGSHSTTHINLMNNHAQTWAEASVSRQDLKAELGIPINTFAYPYGAADTFVMQKISQYGYLAAVGLGISSKQGPDNQFYLNRIEVKYGTTMDEFATLLPWSDPKP
jgi:peptidoglycan/xylan/chitin deacetylase (PgdA/CDA1 family)